MVEGQRYRYLFLSYGPLHTSGVFRKILEHGPGVIMVHVSDAIAIGETGDIGRAQKEEKYEEDQSGPLHGEVFIPWHDVSKILIQG